MLKVWLAKQVAKKGIMPCILWVLGLFAKLTKSKKDDKVVAKIKEFVKSLDE